MTDQESGPLRSLLQFLRSGLARHAGWMVSGATVQGAVAFGANLVLVRLLLPEEFGRFAIVEANIGIVAAVVNFRVGDLLLREPGEKIGDSVLSVYMGALGVQTIVVGLGAFTLLWLFDLLRVDAGILLLSSLASAWVSAQITLFERSFDYRGVSLIETGAHAGGHVFAVVGALGGLGSLVLYLRPAIQLAGRLMGLSMVDGLRSLPLRWPGGRGWKRLIHKIRGFWLDGVLESSFERIAILLVGALVGERGTGFFYQARRLAEVPHQLSQPVTHRIAYNLFSHRLPDGRRIRGLRKALTWEVGVLTAGAVATIDLADPVVPWMFGPGWEPVVPLLMAMAGVIVGLTVLNTLNAYFMALGRLRPFIVMGRGGQYLGLGLLAGAVAVWPVLDGALGLSFGLSAAYLLGSLLPALYLAVRGSRVDVQMEERS